MAHDRQLPNDQAESNNALSAVKTPLKELSDIVADWLTLFSQTYREEVTPELAILYREVLKDIRPAVLHQAFLNATKRGIFRPTPAEIRAAAEAIVGARPRPAECAEDCVVCRGTGWRMVPRTDGQGEWARPCECRSRK